MFNGAHTIKAHERSPPSLVQLPGSGMILQELPASYAADLDRYSSSTRRSSSAVDSGVLSPDALSPGNFDGTYRVTHVVGEILPLT